MSDNRGDSRSAAVRIAIPLLWVLIGSALVIVAWRSYQAIHWVHGSLRTEFLLIYAGYPLALVVVELVALTFLYKRHNAGRILAALVFAIAGYHAASQFWTAGEIAYPGELERAAGRIAAGLATTGLFLLALSLIREHLRGKGLVGTRGIS